jgi:hypothetical protein
VHACERQLESLANGRALNEQERNLLGQTRVELQILLDERLFFHSQGTYDAVARIDRDLDDLLRLSENDSPSQVRFWHGTLEPHLHQATGQLFGEVQQLMGEG